MKYLLIRETVFTYRDIWAVRYNVYPEMPKDLPPYMRSATKVFEADTYEELMTYFK